MDFILDSENNDIKKPDFLLNTINDNSNDKSENWNSQNNMMNESRSDKCFFDDFDNFYQREKSNSNDLKNEGEINSNSHENTPITNVPESSPQKEKAQNSLDGSNNTDNINIPQTLGQEEKTNNVVISKLNPNESITENNINSKEMEVTQLINLKKKRRRLKFKLLY